MKKLLLSIAFILVASITMAQRVVTAIDTEKAYTLECRSSAAHNTTRFIGVDADGVIDGQSATAAEIKFEAADAENSYYIKVGEKYLNHNGTNISASTEKQTAWTFGVGGKDNVANVVTFTIGNDKYLNNNGSDCSDGTCKNLKANSHPGGPASGNACSLWQMCEIDPDYKVINDPADFQNGEIYTFVTERGWMGAKDDNDNLVSSAYEGNNVTGSKEDANFQWTVYKSEKNNYYLYNIGKAMFMGVQTENNAAVPFDDQPVGKKLTFKKSSNATYPIMLSTDNAGVINHSTSYVPGLINWTGGWTILNDPGSNHQVEVVGTLPQETLNSIAELVAAYELINTEAVAALSEAIENFTQIIIGEGVGKYTATDADYQEKFNAIVAYRDAIESQTTPTATEVEEKIGEIDAIIASFQLNMPEAGKCYRIAYDYGGEVGVLYMQGVNSDVKGVQFTAEDKDASIWCYDGALKSYTAEKYLVEHGNTRGLQDAGVDVEFSASPRAIGKYCIKIGSFIHANSGDGQYFTDHCGNDGGHAAHDFIIEEVEVVVEPENPTAVENVETGNEKVEIYDLTGRKVENITKAGVYIVNGCKVLVK